MEWLPIEKCPKQKGVMYIVSGWEDNKPDGERWYLFSTYTEGEGWWDNENCDMLYPPTHFAFFNPV